MRLIKTVFFNDGKSGKDGQEVNSEEDWADAIQTLLSAGHSLKSVKEYTLEQFSVMTHAVARQKMREAQSALMITAVASQGDNKAIKKVSSELDPDKAKKFQVPDQFIDGERKSNDEVIKMLEDMSNA